MKQYELPKPACSKEDFLQCVQKHQIRNLRPDSPTSINRHLIFANPEDSNQWFEIVTWSGTLCYLGDMGTYIFSRNGMEDLFEFFRRAELKINPDYWSGKCTASGIEGIKKFNPETFCYQVQYYLDDETDQDLRTNVEEEVLCYVDEDEYRAREALSDFRYGGFTFQDFNELDCTEFTYHFLWCLYAIVWGIQQYDKNYGD